MITGKFGRYEIVSEIARGGMATVYHAYDPSFEREIALKVLPQAFLHDPQFRTRFDREAKMIARLEHPMIVPVYDFGEENGQPYIVMRYMSGGSLKERIQQGPMALDDVCKIAERIAQALDAAHARGMIHRDIKPGNILFDRYGNAYLSDFGIARLSDDAGATITGSAIIGTPAYMSPEQVQGQKEIDGRSDVYALGALIYQMLTATKPYDADTPAKIMMMHIMEPVPNLLGVRSDLPPGCEALINKAMAKSPEARFASAGELAAALISISKGETIETLMPDADALVAPVSGKIRAADAATRISDARTVIVPPKAKERTGSTDSTPMLFNAGKYQKRGLLVFGFAGAVIICFVLVAGIGLVSVGRQGRGPLAVLFEKPSATPASIQTPKVSPTVDGQERPQMTTEEHATAANPTETSAPTDTVIPPTETMTPTPAVPIIGGADKIAFLNANDIWVANLDGTELMRLTDDATEKTNLQWSPDGKAVIYISGKCVQSADLASGRIDIITCFNYVDYLKIFEISHDAQKVAISLDNQLYIVPYDMEQFSQVQTRGDLTAMAECKELAPYERSFVKMARWSADDQSIAVVMFGVAADIGSADIVQVFSLEFCTDRPGIIDNFPPPRFRMPAYEQFPAIPNFNWDGLYLFVFNTLIRRNGYGDLYVYNMDLHKARMELNPVDGKCCYQDAAWSPDNTHLLFAFQDYTGGGEAVAKIYLVPYGSVDTGAAYDPLPLPDIINTEHPLPILRPALTP